MIKETLIDLDIYCLNWGHVKPRGAYSEFVAKESREGLIEEGGLIQLLQYILLLLSAVPI